jgi:hypothetical protein
MQPNIVPPIIKSAAEQVADHFVVNHSGLVPNSYADLSSYYGVSKPTVRQGIRLASQRLAGQGQTVTVPNRGNKQRMNVTNDGMVFAMSIRDRITAIATEMGTYQTSLDACGIPAPSVSLAVTDINVMLSNILATIP